ncbi:MAG: hypothetical protein PHH98_01515 [Candidatus Gracilibacteria bacterium]|nr:hypothetical protein [Candidatus Gracilibacteria bacterium]
MGTLLKSDAFKGRKVVNKNELTSGVNDGNVTKFESIKRKKITSDEIPEIELFSSKIRTIVNEIVGELTDKWHKNNGLFRYFSEEGLKKIADSSDILSDKMFIYGLLTNERLSNTESKTYVPFSDEEKLGHIKEFLIIEFKDKIDSLLGLNSNSYNNAFVINLFNK